MNTRSVIHTLLLNCLTLWIVGKMVDTFQTTQVGAFSLPESSTFYLFLGVQLANVLMVLVMVRYQTGDKQLPVPTMTRMPDNKWR